MPPLPEDEKKKKINTSPYLMTGTSPENKGFGISPVMQDAFSRRPDRSFADTAGAETYDTAAIARQQQPREVSTTGQAIAAQMAGAPYRIGTQDAEPAASPAQLSALSGKGLPQSEWVAGSYKDEMGAETPYLLDKKTGATRGVNLTSAPYQNGQELIGKDGKAYIVRNGKPVLKG